MILMDGLFHLLANFNPADLCVECCEQYGDRLSFHKRRVFEFNF